MVAGHPAKNSVPDLFAVVYMGVRVPSSPSQQSATEEGSETVTIAIKAITQFRNSPRKFFKTWKLKYPFCVHLSASSKYRLPP
jgi:hypothetical protein